MTQEQFADAVGISRRTVINYETGKHQRIALSVSQMKQLVELMKQAGLPIDELPDGVE